jgi:tetratricopeptide (TPR) repeat protein
MSTIEKHLKEVFDLARDANYDLAFARLRDLENNFPNDAEVFRQRAYVLARKGDFRAAIDELSRAIGLQPNEPDYFYTRARYQLHVGQYQSAVDDLYQVLSLSDEHRSDYYRMPSHLLMAHAFVRMRRFEEARAECIKVPDDASVWIDGSISRNSILAQVNSQSESE